MGLTQGEQRGRRMFHRPGPLARQSRLSRTSHIAPCTLPSGHGQLYIKQSLFVETILTVCLLWTEPTCLTMKNNFGDYFARNKGFLKMRTDQLNLCYNLFTSHPDCFQNMCLASIFISVQNMAIETSTKCLCWEGTIRRQQVRWTASYSVRTKVDYPLQPRQKWFLRLTHD